MPTTSTTSWTTSTSVNDWVYSKKPIFYSVEKKKELNFHDIKENDVMDVFNDE